LTEYLLTAFIDSFYPHVGDGRSSADSCRDLIRRLFPGGLLRLAFVSDDPDIGVIIQDDRQLIIFQPDPGELQPAAAKGPEESALPVGFQTFVFGKGRRQ